jgi:Mg2+ and Co2+ transporter CorA
MARRCYIKAAQRGNPSKRTLQVVGAFDVFMTQTAQRTTNVMRVLTIVSLTLLPATLIAAILGVKMLPKYLLHSWVIWAGIGLMVVIAAVVLLTMRLLRHWL